MSAATKTVIEFVLIGVLGLAAGFGVNAVRAKGSLKVSKNYFDRGTVTRPVETAVPSPTAAPAAGEATKPPPTDGPDTSDDAAGTGETTADATGHEPDTADRTTAAEPPVRVETADPEPAESAHMDHDYKEIRFEEVVAVFEDPLTASGLNVFVDARNDDLFAEGHIPGAVQCDPYQVEHYIDDVLIRANGAEKVIVYCNGGNCEDSIFMCRELLAAGVPYEAIYLFAGGWEAWTANNMPVARGSE